MLELLQSPLAFYFAQHLATMCVDGASCAPGEDGAGRSASSDRLVVAAVYTAAELFMLTENDSRWSYD